MTVLSTFLKSSLSFLFNNLKKHYKIWYSQEKTRCQSLTCQKHSLKGQVRSGKITGLSTFLEFSLNFLSNNLKKHYKIWYSQWEKRCQNLKKNFTGKLQIPYFRQLIFTLPIIYPSLDSHRDSMDRGNPKSTWKDCNRSVRRTNLQLIIRGICSAIGHYP